MTYSEWKRLWSWLRTCRAWAEGRDNAYHRDELRKTASFYGAPLENATDAERRYFGIQFSNEMIAHPDILEWFTCITFYGTDECERVARYARPTYFENDRLRAA